MTNHVNLVKLCVGAERVEELTRFQARRMAETGATRPVHVTRMWPKRAAGILAGGSLYWVFKGAILARQRIAGLEPRTDAEGMRRCAIVLDPEVIRTDPAPRRPFQGWRYLAPGDAPADMRAGTSGDTDLPAEMAAALAAIGVR